MSIEMVPYTAEWEPAVKAWNERLKAGQTGPIVFQFPESHVHDWLPQQDGRKIYVEMYLAVEDKTTVRGAYCVKLQDFWFNGQVQTIGDIGLPLSEGIVNPQYFFLGTMLLKDAVKRYPLMYGLGMGGLENALPRLLKALGWSLKPVPFAFRFIHPGRCVRQLRKLRSTKGRRLATDLIAFTGAGWVGMKLFDLFTRLRNPGFKRCDAEEVPNFGPWADELWERVKEHYPFSAVRDSTAMNTLYGGVAGERCHFIKMTRAGKVIGWAMVRDSTVTDHNHFGNLRIGTLVDGLASPEDVPAVIAQATRFLEKRGVDLIVTNQANQTWLAGLKANGYLKGPSNFILALSKPLAALIGPIEERFSDYHINRADGDGPINL